MTGLTGDDYAELAESYEQEPPRRGELVGEPVLNPRPAWDDVSGFYEDDEPIEKDRRDH